MKSSYTASSFTDISITRNNKYRISEYKENDIISGRYRVLDAPIPCNGTIFKCFDLVDHSPCILKEIPAHGRGLAEHRNEAKLFAMLPGHPNIVRLRRLEIVSGSVMLVQDWLKEDLSAYMKRKTLTEEEITEIILSVCRGLDHCIRFLSSNERIYYHGDIKPGNIFVTSDEKFLLADFGGGSTPHYESPEQTDRRKGENVIVDYRTDIFSIGRLIQKLCENSPHTAYIKELLELAEACTEKDPDLRIKRIPSIRDIYRRLSHSEIERNPDCRMNISQLLNLVRLGERIDFKELTTLLYQADQHEVCHAFCEAGDVFLQCHSPENAITLYGSALHIYNMKGASYGEDYPIYRRICAGLAKGYALVSAWDNAIRYAQEANAWLPPDYEALEVLLYSLLSKTAKEIARDHPDADCNYAEEFRKRIPLSPIIASLEELYSKFPKDPEPAQLLCYVYSNIDEPRKVIHYYEKADKDSYATRFYYAKALYSLHQISKARQEFKELAEYLKDMEVKSQFCSKIFDYCVDVLENNDAFLYLTLYKKATALAECGKIIESIPFYREAYRNAPDLYKKGIKDEEKNILLCIYNEPDSFYEMLLEKAEAWSENGGTDELKALISDYCLMFTDLIYIWLDNFSGNLDIFDDVHPLINLLEAFHRATLPEFSEAEDPKEIEIALSPSVKELCPERPSDLKEIALALTVNLLEYARKYEDMPALLRTLKLQGELLFERKEGARQENLTYALEDFDEILKYSSSVTPKWFPDMAYAAYYRAKIIAEAFEEDRYAGAFEDLQYALSVFTALDDRINAARVYETIAVLAYKLGNTEEAITFAAKVQDNITISDDRITYARSGYMLGLLSVLLIQGGKKPERDFIDQSIRSLDEALLVFRKDEAEWFGAVKGLIFLYGIKEEIFHDGSWAMQEYYKNQ